jgi:hypothetical protein
MEKVTPTSKKSNNDESSKPKTPKQQIIVLDDEEEEEEGDDENSPLWDIGLSNEKLHLDKIESIQESPEPKQISGKRKLSDRNEEKKETKLSSSQETSTVQQMREISRKSPTSTPPSANHTSGGGGLIFSLSKYKSTKNTQVIKQAEAPKTSREETALWIDKYQPKQLVSFRRKEKKTKKTYF